MLAHRLTADVRGPRRMLTNAVTCGELTHVLNLIRDIIICTGRRNFAIQFCGLEEMLIRPNVQLQHKRVDAQCRNADERSYHAAGAHHERMRE